MNYSVITCSIPRDYNKLTYVLQSLKQHLIPQPDNYIIIHQDQNVPQVPKYVKLIPESSILQKKDTPHYPNRSGWIYQQFLKLFHNICDNYLVIDSDIILNKNIQLFHADQKPFFFIGSFYQNHQPYFDYSTKVFGIDRHYDNTFINEIMFMQKKICLEMLEQFGKHNNLTGSHDELLTTLYHFTCDNCSKNFIPSEYEMYGNFIQQKYPNSYHIKKIKTHLMGKHRSWTNNEIKESIEKYSKTDYDAFTIHTWT